MRVEALHGKEGRGCYRTGKGIALGTKRVKVEDCNVVEVKVLAESCEIQVGYEGE